MDTRTLGSTGLAVTPIGLGLAAVGRPGYINLGRDEDLGSDRSIEAFRARAHDLLDAAYDLGVRYVDAARSYGRAEEFLAGWLEARGASVADVTVGSKWGYTYTAGWRVGAEVNEVKDHSLANLRRQLGESRSLLDGRLRLYQIHSATLESGVLDDARVVAELLCLADEGLAIGLTVSGPRQAEVIRRALEVRLDGRNPFRSVQATWNLLEPSAGAALDDARQAGWGVIVKEALANGRLTGHARGPAVETLRRVADRHAATEDAVALAAVLAQPWAVVALSGAVSAAQLASNARALDVQLSGDDLAALEGLAEPAAAYWAERSRLAWA